jgi:hypothetical protein
MNPALLLLGVYVAVTIVGQLFGFGISRIVDHLNPALGLMTFLVLFIAMFGIAWPIAVYLTKPRAAGHSK